MEQVSMRKYLYFTGNNLGISDRTHFKPSIHVSFAFQRKIGY